MSRVLRTVWLAGSRFDGALHKSATVRFRRTDVVATIAMSTAWTVFSVSDRDTGYVTVGFDAWITEMFSHGWNAHSFGPSSAHWATMSASSPST